MDAATSTTETGGASSRGRPEGQDRASQDREFFAGVARAFAGAVIFALPMLMTKEMWSIGVYLSPWRLVVLMVAMVPLLAGLSTVSGFNRTETWRDAVMAAFVAIAVAAATSTAVLFVFGVVTFETPASEAVGRITLQVFPAGIGAMLARSQMSSGGSRQKRSGQPRSYGREILLMAIGALFLGLGVAPTEEVMLLAYRMGPWREIALALLSLTLMHAFVYTIKLSGGTVPRSGAAFWSLFLRFTVVGYAVVLLVSFYLLWTFGRTDGTEAKAILSAGIVLGFPCAIGAGAARLVL